MDDAVAALLGLSSEPAQAAKPSGYSWLKCDEVVPPSPPFQRGPEAPTKAHSLMLGARFALSGVGAAAQGQSVHRTPQTSTEPAPSQSSSAATDESGDGEEGASPNGTAGGPPRWAAPPPRQPEYSSAGYSAARDWPPPPRELSSGLGDGSHRYCCRFPGCETEYAVTEGYATTDGVRKHCRSQHGSWLRSLPTGVAHFARLVEAPSSRADGLGPPRGGPPSRFEDPNAWAADVLGARPVERVRATSNRHGTRSVARPALRASDDEDDEDDVRRKPAQLRKLA